MSATAESDRRDEVPSVDRGHLVGRPGLVVSVAPVALIALLAAACTPTPKAGADATPARLFFWKVSRADRPATAHLLGSIHVGRKEPTFDRAIVDAHRDAKRLAVELDVEAPGLFDATVRHGFYPEGQTLSGTLSAATMQKLRETLTARGQDTSQLERFRPWFAYFTLLITTMADNDVDFGAGVDLAFLAASRGEKDILSLETADEQLSTMASASEAMQIQLLEAALAEESSTDMQAIEQILTAYEGGDERAVQALVQQSGEGSADAEAFGQRMWQERNRKMASRLDTLLERPEPLFVVVGVGHLLGDDSIVAELVAKGYSVERVAATGGAVPLAVPRPPAPLPSAIRFALPEPVEHLEQAMPNGAKVFIERSTAGEVTFVLSRAPVDDVPAPQRTTLLDGFAQGLAGSMKCTVEKQEPLRLQDVLGRRLDLACQAMRSDALVILHQGGVTSLLALYPSTGSSPAGRAVIDETFRSATMVP